MAGQRFLARAVAASYASRAMMDPNAPVPQHVPQTPYVPPQPPAPKKGGMGAGLVLALGCFGFLALAFAGIVLLGALGSSGGEGGHSTIEDKSVLRMKLGGAIPEHVRSSGFDELFGGTPVMMRQHLFNLEKASKDPRIKGVLL